MAYVPENPPALGGEKELNAYMYRELQRVSAEFELALARSVEFLNVAPKKPREGMVRGADGVNWNPGSGKGVYVYYDDVWNKL